MTFKSWAAYTSCQVACFGGFFACAGIGYPYRDTPTYDYFGFAGIALIIAGLLVTKAKSLASRS